MGEMGTWYSLSRAAFIGGSLLTKAANPIETVQLNTFILHGPHIYNSKRSMILSKVGLCFQVSGEKDIVQQILHYKAQTKILVLHSTR